MPAAEPNKILRLIVPFVVGLAGVLIAVGVFTGSKPAAKTTDAETAQTTPETPPAAGDDTDAPTELVAAVPESDMDAQPEPPVGQPQAQPDENASDTTDQPALDLTGLRARPQPIQPDLASLGSAVPDSDYPLLLEFTQEGAGVEAITLANYAQTLGSDDRYGIQRKTTLTASNGVAYTVTALAARGVRINGEFIDLFGSPDAPVWQQTAPGVFQATIETAAGEPVARATRRFVITPDSYDIRVVQNLENLTAAPLTTQWIQYGPVDLPIGESTYLRDARRVWFGSLLATAKDPSRQIVERSKIRQRQNVIDKPLNANGLLWPAPNAEAGSNELVFASLSNRYFAFAVHPPISPEAAASGQPLDKRFTSAAQIYRVTLTGVPEGGVAPETHLILELHGPATTLAPGATEDLSIGAYAGPLSRRTLGEEPLYQALGLDSLIVYNIGGPCAFCTFQPLARGLLWFLSLLHDYILFDWALAIMILVVFVRGVLHPITKKAQIRMQRFSKQMQGLAPKQKKLQEKFKDDPKRLQQEMARLMREEGIDFTGALGCLPMFLQTPIWIALYAMLFYAFDLRHEAAYFGLFQNITGGAWGFMADLSAPDRFFDFGRTLINLPLLGAITSINILPLILGVVFFIQQKYLTPPPTSALTPEQETQQKIMKVVLVVMFPLFMYQAPSGLSLYFITNSTLGILESRYIRAHIATLPEPEPRKKRVPKGEGPQRPRKRVLNESSSGFKERKKKK